MTPYAERAALLAARFAGSAAVEPLLLAEELFRAQAAITFGPLAGSFAADAQQIAQAARAVLNADVPLVQLETYWRGERGDYFARAALQPYARELVARGQSPDAARLEHGCPHCGAAAWVASRREGAALLHCSLCLGHWPVARVSCPACGEADPAKLPRFTAEQHPAARIDACDACKRYLKSIDLTLDGQAIPEIDELLSLSVDLWAQEQGYHRIEPGLAGV